MLDTYFICFFFFISLFGKINWIELNIGKGWLKQASNISCSDANGGCSRTICRTNCQTCALPHHPTGLPGFAVCMVRLLYFKQSCFLVFVICLSWNIWEYLLEVDLFHSLERNNSWEQIPDLWDCWLWFLNPLNLRIIWVSRMNLHLRRHVGSHNEYFWFLDHQFP